MKNIFFKSRHIKAFTLVETLTAMTIIILTILGPLTVAVYSSSYATETRDNMTATYLAEEAIELLKYKRDSEYLACFKNNNCSSLGVTLENQAWVNFKKLFGMTGTGPYSYGGDCFSSAGCSLDIYSIDDVTPVIASCSYLYRNEINPDPTNSSTYVYSCKSDGNNRSTSFTRNIKMEHVPATADDYSDDIRVTVKVGYKKSNGYDRDVTLVDFLHSRP